MIALCAVLLMTAACLGAGAALLRVASAPTRLPVEAWAWSFVLGFGILGWTVFPLGIAGGMKPFVLLLLCLAALPGLVFLPCPNPVGWPSLTVLGVALGTAATVAALGDVMEALAPPADADTMAYHFFIPKLFLEAGRIYFIPRASDGAAPLLPQMTYAVALALGGERALMLWTMASGWGTAFAAYAVGRRYMTSAWSAATALIFATLPAVLYGAGTGQVETRIAGFVLVTACAAAEACQERNPRYALVAGLAAGFYAASKFPGLLFVASVLLVLVARRGGVKLGLIFALSSAVAGGEWYLWNAWNTGDPFFPLLFGILPYFPGVPWNETQHTFMQTYFFGGERALPRTLFWLFGYLPLATFAPAPVFEAGRTGLGPFLVLVLPFAVFGAWTGRTEQALRPALLALVIAATAYLLWFFLGPSQRVRHLLPLVPLVLVGLVALAIHAVRLQPVTRSALAAGLGAMIFIQLGGQGLATAKYVRYVVGDETRAQFLSRNLALYGAVEWINANLGPTDRVLVPFREINYLLQVPVFYAHPFVQAQIEIRPDVVDPLALWAQMRQHGVTHALVEVPPQVPPDSQLSSEHLLFSLASRNCAVRLHDFTIERHPSRTLATPGESQQVEIALFAVQPNCPS